MSPESVLRAVDRRATRWALLTAFAAVLLTSVVWDGNRVGGIAGALFVLGLVAFLWMLAPRQRGYRAIYAALGIYGLLKLGCAIAGTQPPVALSIALLVICLYAFASAFAIFVRLFKSHASAPDN